MANSIEKFNISGLSGELEQVVLAICESYEQEDRPERLERRSLWLKLENYMNGLQRRYWNTVAQDWRRLPDDSLNETTRHYDKIINVYRAHLEAITAALSVKTPSAIFYPEDADIMEDVSTAEACVHIKEIIERHNEAKLLFIRAITILFNCGVVAAYIYNRKNTKYGNYKKPTYGDKTVKVKTVLLNCTDCGSNIDELIFKGDSKEANKSIEEEVRECPVCSHKGIPDKEEFEEEVPEIKSYGMIPKTRTIIETFSPLFVHMPFYARKQELMPWLKLEFEQHYSLIRQIYPQLYKKNNNRGPSAGQVDRDSAEFRGIRIDTQTNLVTTKCWWVRPEGYNINVTNEDTESKVKSLKEKFPDGFYAIILDKKLVEIHNECLDDHWQISHHPMSTYIHAEPLGKPLAPIQDLTNEVVDLQIETFEHSIPETFARGDVLDFKKYGDSRAKPGMIYPVIAPSDGKSIGESFHSVKTATLSEESELFLNKLDNKGQFVIGSFPSIYGGPATSGSKTAREYSESRAMALQRLTISWNVLKFWWANVMGVAVTQFIHALRTEGEDHKEVIKTSTGFVNQWIRQTDIEGNIGRVEADAEEDLPQSPAQLKDIFMNLLSLKDESLSIALLHPENTPFIAKALGVPDFYIPGADARKKQFSEFSELLKGGYVEVREWEDHEIEAETTKQFMISGTGRIIKKQNPDGYSALEVHYQEHMNALMAKENPVKPEINPAQPAPVADNTELGMV